MSQFVCPIALLFYAFNSWANTVTVNSIIYELGTRDSVAHISELRNVGAAGQLSAVTWGGREVGFVNICLLSSRM